MILHPSGEPWQMPQSFLEHSPFHSYLIPGITLLLANGLLSFMALAAVLRRRHGYSAWVLFQGCVLGGWIVVEMAMLRMAMWAHYFYGAVALILIVLGLELRREERAALSLRSSR
jgi:hypothetical protein